MKPAPAEGEIAARDERRELLSELFHALNQPLTTLRCALELSLQRPHSEEEYRYTMEAALQQAENVTRLTCGIRELLEGDDPGDHPQAVALDASVQEAVLDWLPVAEAAQITLLAQNLSPCQVRFEPQRLRRALFHLQEFVLHSAAGDAIRKGGEDRTKIREAILATKDYVGVLGRYSFTPNGDSLHTASVVQIENGKPKFLKAVSVEPK